MFEIQILSINVKFYVYKSRVLDQYNVNTTLFILAITHTSTVTVPIIIGVITAAVFVILLVLVILIIMLRFGYLLISYKKAVIQSEKDNLYMHAH